MIPEAFITEWRKQYPWPDNAYVEQDLVISRILVELFSRSSIRDNLMFRGGTALHKLYLTPSQRYSEDIDLVQIHPGSIGSLFDLIRETLEPFMGKPNRKLGPNVVNLVFKFNSEMSPVRRLKLKIEINTREHFSVYPRVEKLFHVDSNWFHGSCTLPTYRLEELLGTKMRALYQRKKGRDLFDLWMGLTHGNADPAGIIESFNKYMEKENQSVSGKDYRQNLESKIKDTQFLSDVSPLIRSDTEYNPGTAMELVMDVLVSSL